MRAVFDAIDDVGGVEQIPDEELKETLGRISREILEIRSDFRHTPGAWYFHSEDEQMSLPLILPRLVQFARACHEREEPVVKMRAKMLLRSLEALTGTVRDSCLKDAPDEESIDTTIRRWRREILHDEAEA